MRNKTPRLLKRSPSPLLPIHQAILAALEFVQGRWVFMPDISYWERGHRSRDVFISAVEDPTGAIFVLFRYPVEQKQRWICEIAVYNGKVVAGSFNVKILSGFKKTPVLAEPDIFWNQIAAEAIRYCFTTVNQNVDWKRGICVAVETLKHEVSVYIHGLNPIPHHGYIMPEVSLQLGNLFGEECRLLVR